MALPQILCQLHDHAKQYDNDECVMMNGMMESCMVIYLGMAMEMPYVGMADIMRKVYGGFNATAKVAWY